MHPLHATEVFLIDEEQHQDEEENEIPSEHHHDAEHIERQWHVGHRLFGRVKVAIAKVLEVTVDGGVETVGDHLVAAATRHVILFHHRL